MFLIDLVRSDDDVVAGFFGGQLSRDNQPFQRILSALDLSKSLLDLLKSTLHVLKSTSVHRLRLRLSRFCF